MKGRLSCRVAAILKSCHDLVAIPLHRAAIQRVSSANAIEVAITVDLSSQKFFSFAKLWGLVSSGTINKVCSLMERICKKRMLTNHSCDGPLTLTIKLSLARPWRYSAAL